MTTAEVGFFLVGNLTGVCLVFILTGLAWWFVDVRKAIEEGTPLVGEALERAKRRGDS